MLYSENWLRFRKSEDEYFACRHRFMHNAEEMISDLRIALSVVDDMETALRFLLEIKPKVAIIAPLISRIVDDGIDSSNLNTVQLTKSLLYNYKDEPLIKNIIVDSITKYLENDDDWQFRRIAELYELLGYKKELNDFILFCQTNDNLEIQEIGNDFYHKLD